MRSARVLIAVAAAVLSAACETPVEPGHGPHLEPDGVLSSVVGPVTEQASGTMYRFVPLADGSVVRVRMHVNATKQQDGSVHGSFTYEAGATALAVDVTCMTVVDGNRAWIAGVIRESTIGFVGHVSYFYAFDNGEGTPDESDVVSLVRVEVNPGLGEAQRFCDELPAILPPRVVDQGNVNIRG